ncbi:MAG: hypothetical protein DMF49_03535 [Acidobacteria bacterium]|nr:MAG: hypothetical protein DMF49_03535 [Acidobacteriota bacterium]
MAGPEDDLASRLRDDLLPVLLQRGRAASIMQVLAASATGLLLLTELPGLAVLASICLVVAVAGGGLVVCVRFAVGALRPASARKLFLAACAATGCAWAAAAGFGLRTAGTRDEMVLVLVLAGLMVMAAATLEASIHAFMLFSVPLALSLTAAILVRPSELGGVRVAAVVAMLFLLSAGTAIQINRGRRHHLRDEYELEAGRQALIEANHRLEQAKLTAEEAARVKQRFAASVSHEIRTPMSGIIGITNLLFETDVTDEQRQYLDMLKNSGDVLLQLINDILDFSKIEAGKMRLEKTEFDLGDMLDSLVDQFAEQAARKGLELVCGIDTGVPRRLNGDPGRLRQVLVNLVSNALKFTEAGEVVVRVSAEGARDGKPVLRFAVRDTGIGIGGEEQERIFEPFSQAEPDTTRKYGGTGLGLAIVREIALMMDGRIELESRPGKGSAFTLVAPMELAEEDEPVPCGVELSGVKALVVDDSETSRRFLQEVLQSWGCRPESVTTGEDALPLMREAARTSDPFRVVLMDMGLPGMDGFAATREIRADPAMSDAMVLMLSSFGIRGDAARARDAGCAGYMTKPIKSSQLQQVIRGALSLAVFGGPERIVTQYSARRSATRRGRILVAEDSPVNQRVAEMLLRHRGHEVVIVETGRQALQALERQEFDLVLMDVQMPEMDGLQATRRLRSDSRWRDLPVIAMTAHVLAGDRSRFLLAGMNEQLSKPFQPADLDALLQKYLPLSGAGSPGTAVDAGSPVACRTEPAGAGSAGRSRDADGAQERPPFIDWEGALERHLGEEKLLREALELFREWAEGQIERIGAAVAATDASQLEREAHGLKGSAGMLGILPMAETARNLEMMARAEDLSLAAEALDRLQKEAVETFAYIELLAAEKRGSFMPEAAPAGIDKI